LTRMFRTEVGETATPAQAESRSGVRTVAHANA
jgi:hypothetical protein